MSRPYQHNFDSPQSPLNRQAPSNPATPSSAGGQLTSYKTNVNRAKTKRWVEAPSYSYDGDDWGEVDDYDEYGGYDEPSEPSEPPRATGLRQRGQSINQAPPSSYDGSRGPQQELKNDGRRAYGDISGQLPVQHHNHGLRSTTNQGQPYHGLQNARSNSFDRGDESRAFSAGSAQHGMVSASDATATVHEDRNPVINPQTINATNFNPASAPQGSYRTPPPHPQPSRQGPPGPPLQVQTGSNIQGQARNLDQALSPTASYRGVSYSEQGRHPSSGSRAQSMTSNTSSLDFHGRRDFSPSALPQPLHPHVSAGPQGANEAARFPPRQSSLSQQGSPYAPIGHDTRPALEGSDEDSSPLNPVSGNNAKPLPFVRPADIYKRMEEERERERRSQDSARPSMDAIMRKATDREASPNPSNPTEQSSLEGAGRPLRLHNSLANSDFADSNQRPDTTIDPWTQRKRDEHGFDGVLANNHSTSTQHGIGNDAALDFVPAEHEQNLASNQRMLDHPVLPNVDRVSGFGESFFNPLERAQDHESQGLGTEPPAPVPSSNDRLSPSDATIGSLQHQPSVGFRTVVRQAFDDQVPPTPSSLADSSVARTNSESTSGISPIMSRGPSAATANPTLKDREVIPGGTRTITEVVDEDFLRPTSGSTIGLPKPNWRKPSPSLVESGESGAMDQTSFVPSHQRKPSPSLVESGESGALDQTSFVPSHQRNLSTPSPVNSPARTAALEVNGPMRRPQEVEMAMATPIEANRDNGQDSSLWENARGHDQRGSTDYTTREADVALTGNESAEGHTPIAANAVKDARSSFLENRRINNIESPTAPVASPSSLRAESPSKNRVRDLAGMFESGSHSKSGSESSSPLRGNSFGANTLFVDDAASRPAAGRLESFRPRLPGGWESFASTAPSIAPYVSNNGKERGTSTTPAADARNTTITSRDRDTNDDIDVMPTTVKRGLSKSEHDYQGGPLSTLEDPFSAVAAAGNALAGALAAVVGLGNGQDATDRESESHAKSNPDPVADDFGAARGRSASLLNNVIHPEASKTANRLPATASVSSGAPTPPPKDTPLVGNEPAADAGYFAPIEPLKNRPRSQITTSDQATPPARPPMLPYMSTDIKPQDLESDRLRKEIVRSLSPVTYTKPEPNVETPSSLDHPLSNNVSLRSQSHDSMVIPSEYDSYWNEPNSEDGLIPRPGERSDYHGVTSPINHPQVQALAENVEQSPPSHGHDRALSAPVHEQQQTEEDMPTPPAALIHRFSWEQEPAAVAAGSNVETLSHSQRWETNARVISDQTPGERETALDNSQKGTDFEERQFPAPRDISNAEATNQAISELPATEQESGTGLAGHTLNLWGPAAVNQAGYDTSSQHSGLYNLTNKARGYINSPETMDGPVVGQISTRPETHHEATPMQSSHDPYSNDPYANDPYAEDARSLPTHHGLEGQMSKVQQFDTHESAPQHASERVSSDAHALNYQEASPQHEPEDQYGDAQATENLLSTLLQHGPHDPMNIAENQNQDPNAQRDDLPPLPPPPAGVQPRIPAFREILALHTAADRIRAYNATREQFANMNTGLEHWISVTASETPEHAGLLSSVGRASAAPASLSGTPTRGKLSGLRPPGAQAAQQPYYQQYLNASSQPTTPYSTTASPSYSELSDRPNLPSSGGSGRVQAKGKDILKNAGVFGGKANVAAKGLFSKGKSRFRSSGGGDKATNTNTSTPSPDPDSVSRGMQPQHQPLDTFQPGQSATSTYQSGPSLPIQAALSPQDNARSLLTADRPLSFIPFDDHVALNRPRAEQISEPRNSTTPLLSEPGVRGPDRETPPTVFSSESDQFGSSSEEPESPDGSLELSKEAVKPLPHDHDSERLQEEAQEAEQGNPVVIGDAAPIFLHQTTQAESYLGSPKEIHSSHSTTSSNRTPTQADFPGLRRSNELPRSQLGTKDAEEIPPVSIRVDQRASPEREPGRMVTQEETRDARSMPQPSSIRLVNAPMTAHQGPGPSVFGGSGLITSHIGGRAEAGADVWPPPNTRVEQPYPTDTPAAVDGMFHTTQSSREAGAVPPQEVNRHSTPRASVQMDIRDAAYASAGGANTTTSPVRQGPAILTSAPKQQATRPFSFIEYASKEPAHPSRDFKPREPSIDSLSDEVHQDRPPSPISPARSLTRNHPDGSEESIPVQYGPDRDIVPADDRSSPPNRHRSFSRPFKSPDIAQHPAYRQEQELQPLTEATDLPTQYYPAQIRREEAFLPRQQGAEYQLEGVGPPPMELFRTKSRSRRSSRGSGFFKNLGNSPKSDIPPVPTGFERQNATPPIPSSTPTGTDKKAKRASLFRSLTGRGSGSDRSKESITAPAPASRTDFLQQPQPKSPSADSEDFPTRGKSKKLRDKLKRDPSASATEPDSAKKKRFSALGSLFGRSSSSKRIPSSPVPQSAHPALPSQQFRYSSQSQQQPRAPGGPTSALYTTQDQEYLPPPPGGYYAPAPRNPSPPRDFGPDNRRLANQHQHQYMQPSNNQPDPYQQQQQQPGIYPDNPPQSMPPTGTSSEPRPTRELYPGSNSWQRDPHPPTHSRTVSAVSAVSASSSVLPRPHKSNTFFRPASPLPPPPPPKDEWRLSAPQPPSASPRARTPSASPFLSPSPSRSPPAHLSPPTSRSPHSAHRQALPPLRTDVSPGRSPGRHRPHPQPTPAPTPTPTPTPLEARRARQLQIERAGMGRAGGSGSKRGGEGGGREGREGGSEEEIVMSSTSYPGQEWQPGWDGV